MYYTIIVLFALFMILAITYLFFHFKNLSFIKKRNKPRWLPFLLAFILVGICFVLSYTVSTFSSIVILYLLYAFVICDILQLLLRKILKSESLKSKWNWIYQNGFLVFLITICFLGVSYYNAIHVEIKEYSFTTKKTLTEENLKIAMIADLHLDTTMSVLKLEEYCKEINEGNPDMILLLGDIFDENTKKASMELACKTFSSLTSTYGTYYVFGNHDLGSRGLTLEFTKEDIVENFTRNGITVLDDQSILLNGNIYLIGRSDVSFLKDSDRLTLPQLLEPLDSTKLLILLDHQPLEIEEAASLGIDLQLAGHTHGGQIWPTGVIAKWFHINEINYGYREIGDYRAIVTSGIGAWSYPLRLGSKSEIVFITITNP